MPDAWFPQKGRNSTILSDQNSSGVERDTKDGVVWDSTCSPRGTWSWWRRPAPGGPTSICSRWICCRLTAAGVRMFHTDLGSGIREGGGQGSRGGGVEIGDRTSATPPSAVTAGNCLHGIRRRPQRWEGAKSATARKLRNRRHPPNPQSNQRRANVERRRTNVEWGTLPTYWLPASWSPGGSEGPGPFDTAPSPHHRVGEGAIEKNRYPQSFRKGSESNIWGGVKCGTTPRSPEVFTWRLTWVGQGSLTSSHGGFPLKYTRQLQSDRIPGQLSDSVPPPSPHMPYHMLCMVRGCT